MFKRRFMDVKSIIMRVIESIDDQMSKKIINRTNERAKSL